MRLLGEVVTLETELGPWPFIVSSILENTIVLTPIPKGMTEADLGRKFPGARIEPARYFATH